MNKGTLHSIQAELVLGGLSERIWNPTGTVAGLAGLAAATKGKFSLFRRPFSWLRLGQVGIGDVNSKCKMAETVTADGATIRPPFVDGLGCQPLARGDYSGTSRGQPMMSGAHVLAVEGGEGGEGDGGGGGERPEDDLARPQLAKH